MFYISCFYSLILLTVCILYIQSGLKLFQNQAFSFFSSQIYLFSFNAFVQALYSKCPGSYTILFQGFNQAPMFPILLYSKFSNPSLYHFILGSQAPMPPIPFYSRFPGPYTSYIIVFIGAKAPMPPLPFYSWFPGSYTSYIFVFQVPWPLCLLYYCILGAQAPCLLYY